MKRISIPLGLTLALVLPATAAAAPTSADRSEGKRECRQLLRTVDTRANFVQVVKLEAKANRRNAFGRCVKVRTADATGERRAAFKAAKEACAALKPAAASGRPANPGAPATRGRPANPGAPATRGRPAAPGAYGGRCVSTAARALGAKADASQREATLNPARICRGKQLADADAFRVAFPGKSGFGKCVSTEASAQKDVPDTPE